MAHAVTDQPKQRAGRHVFAMGHIMMSGALIASLASPLAAQPNLTVPGPQHADTVPAQPPEGANGAQSTYLHVLVCDLE